MSSFPRTNRARGHELLDEECADPVLLRAELSVLQRLNRMTSASRGLLDAIAARLALTTGQRISVVDFGCGGGDILHEAMINAPRRGWTLRAVATDSSPACIRHCQETAPADGITYLLANLLRDGGEFQGERFDVAHASLVLHHFGDEEVVSALRRMAAVTDRLVVWNDLIRDRIGVAGAFLITVGASAAVRHDAILSVRRAFTLEEARSFAEAAGLEDIEVRRWRGARFILTARPPSAATSHAARPLIRAEGVRFGFGSNRVVSDWSMMTRSGEVTLLEGPNGSGKSTRMRLLAGVLRADGGRVWCDRAQGPVGYLPQHGGLVSSLDVHANMSLLQQVARVPRADRRARVEDVLRRLGLGSFAGRPIAKLSVGQARRAAVATVFATAGMVLLLDEPDAGLDTDGRKALGELITEQATLGRAIAIASHEPAWLEKACASAGIPLWRGHLR